MDYKTSLNGNKTDLRLDGRGLKSSESADACPFNAVKQAELALNDLFGTMEVILNDIQNLKLKAYEPTKIEAKVFLDYLTWEEDSNPKKNFEAIYSKELELFHEWLKIYCEIHKCTKEEALERVIEG